MNPSQRDSELVVELARTLIGFMEDQHAGWSRAFFRFHADEEHYGSTASYEQGGAVMLFSAMRMKDFFEQMNGIAYRLWCGGLGFKVMLLTVRSDYDYDIQFENQDAQRWRITKMDGATGIPSGMA